jgi:AraC-like DNA-binding protein
VENITVSLNIVFLGLIAVIALFCAITVFVILLPQNRTIRLLVAYFLLLFVGYLLAIVYVGNYFAAINWGIIVLFLSYLASLLFFFFVQKYLRKNYSIKGITILVFVPSLFLFFVVIYDVIYPNNKALLKFLNNYYLYIFDIVYILVLNLINLNTIYWYKKTVLTRYSSLQKHEYKWVSSIVYAKFLYGVLPLLFVFLSYGFHINISSNLKHIILDSTVIVVLVFILVKTLLNAKNTKPIEINSKIIEFTKIDGNKRPSKEQQDLLDKILLNFERNKTYKNSELTIQQLASILEVKPRLLSSTINTCLNQNFYDFINFHRIKEAKRILQLNIDTKLTIAEVMYSVGYNSKSSFNTAFKKFTKHTPSFYHRNNKLV